MTWYKWIRSGLSSLGFQTVIQKNWMNDSGDWWYDSTQVAGEAADPSYNADMISPAFWLVGGSELKITRNDNCGHTPLLQTIGELSEWEEIPLQNYQLW